jgi:hypothetical protein
VFVCLATVSCWLEDWVSIGKLREKHVCLEASWLQECKFVPEERRGWARTCVWRLPDYKNVSSCWEITGRGHVEGVLCGTSLSVEARRVFGEWLTVLNWSVLTFWKGNKLPYWIEPPVRYSMYALGFVTKMLYFLCHTEENRVWLNEKIKSSLCNLYQLLKKRPCDKEQNINLEFRSCIVRHRTILFIQCVRRWFFFLILIFYYSEIL